VFSVYHSHCKNTRNSFKNAVTGFGDGIPYCQKGSQSLPHKRQIKSKSFSAGACTWQKIPLRLQVWNLSAASR
jgi:hypothetical protein